MKLEITRVCAGLIIVLALFMCLGTATETNWRFSGFELYGYDINFTSHNATNVKNIDADNITSEIIGGIIYADQYTTIQLAIDACEANSQCGEVYIPAGTYDITGQTGSISAVIPINTVGLILPDNIIISGAGADTILQNLTTNIGSSPNLVFVMFVNKNHTVGNSNIIIRDLVINLAPPYETATGMDSWYNAITFQGVSNSEIFNLDMYNGGIDLHPSSTDHNTANVLQNLSNSNNLIHFNRFTNVTQSNTLYQGVSNKFQNNVVSKAWDDSILIGSAGKNNVVKNNNIDGGSPKSPVKGAATAGIYISNDGAVGDQNAQTGNSILGNTIYGMDHYSGDQCGITIDRCNTTRIAGNIIYENNGTGIKLENTNISNTQIIDNIVHSNYRSGHGIVIQSNINKITEGVISRNIIYNHTDSGIYIYTYGTTNYLINDNILFNNVADIKCNTETASKLKFLNYIYNNMLSTLTFYNVNERELTGAVFNNYGVAPFYHGIKSTAPTPYGAGDEYFNYTDNTKYSYDGSNWDSMGGDVGYYGEAYIYNNAVDTIIETASTPIALRQISGGLVNGWTFDAGSTGAITAYIDATGGKTMVVSAGHGLSNGDIITIRGTTSYNGVFTVSDVTTDNFEIVKNWWFDDGASDWDQGASLTAGANSAGKYTARWQMSSAPDAAMTCNWVIYINAVAQTKTTGERKFTQNDYGCCTSMGILDIAAGDVIWLAIQSDGTANVLNKHGNFNIRTV